MHRTFIFRKSLQVFTPFFFPLFLAAQVPQPTISFEHFGTEKGLSHEMVNCMIQDRRGFLWVGTANGLNRFDGYNFKVYKNRQGDISSLSNNTVQSIFEDRDGIIWVGTSGGLNRFDPKTENFRQFFHHPADPKSISFNQISSIFGDKSGDLWLGAFSVLEKFDRKTGDCTHLNPPAFNPDFPSETRDIRSIFEFDGDLFFSAWGAGIWRFRRQAGTFERVFSDAIPRQFQSWAQNFYLDRAGNLMAIDRTVLRFDHARNVFEVLAGNPSEFSQTVVFQLKNGAFLVGTEGRGLLEFDKNFVEKRRTLLDPNHSNHFNNFITLIFEDRGGEIWLGTAGDGLFKFDPTAKKFNSFRHENGLSADNVTAVLETKSDKILVGTRLNGIDIFDPKTQSFSRFQLPAIPFSSHIKTIFRDSRGQIWIGTWGAGLVFFDEKTGQFRNFKYSKSENTSIPNNFVSSIAESLDNKIWVASTEGIAVIGLEEVETGIFKRYIFQKDNPNGLSDLRPDVVFCDSGGKIWVGTAAGGLNLFDPKNDGFKHFLHNQNGAKNLSSSKVLSIFEDSKNRLWIGCSGGGLNLFVPENQHFIHFSEPDGLPNDEVKSMTEDAHGMLWLTTNHGISRFDPARKFFKNYDETDGLPGNHFSPLAILRSRFDGKIYAGAKEGLAVFHPDSIRNSTFLPPVFITNFVKYRTVADQNFAENVVGICDLERLELSYLENTFTVGFSALNFRNAEKNKYAYRLVGLNENWIFSAEKREVTFSNLPPGEYILQVKASNNDDIWNQTSRNLKIIIHPPWWKTWWAMGIWAFLAAATVFQIYRFQLKKKLSEAETARLRELDILKSRLYTNITHEFRTPLTVILGMTEQLETDLPMAKKGVVETIRRNGKNLLGLINQLLDLSKLEHKSLKLDFQRGNVLPFLRYVAESFQSYANAQNLSLRFFSPLENLEMDFDPPQLQNVLTNLISNALKFTRPAAGGGEIWVRFEEKNGQAILSVRDSGIGISEKDLPHIFDRFFQVDNSSTRSGEGTGIGLAYVQELVNLMGGKIEVESRLGEGSVFRVFLPVRQVENVGVRVLDFGEISNFKSDISNFKFPKTEEIRLPNLKGLVNLATENTDLPLLLIIEDNPDVVDYLKSCLAGIYQIEVAFNGEIGIQKAVEFIPDLILSDVMMPGKDGFEVCETLKNDERTSHIPIILLTAKADLPSKIAGLRRGADAYLAKPFDREELMVRLEKLMVLRRRLMAHFASVSQILTLENAPENEGDFSKEDEFIQKIKAILEENIGDEDFGLPQLCQKIGMSRSQLFRKMKALIDRAPADFIKTYRLEKAKMLLSNSDLTVSEVAWQVGFKDLAHFSKSFLEEFGMNPSANWRSKFISTHAHGRNKFRPPSGSK